VLRTVDVDTIIMAMQVRQVVEEEYCLIPMGGTLPKRDQRVIGVGGTAGLVHPSTGYMVARTLGAVPQLADRVVDELMRKLPEERERQGAVKLNLGDFLALTGCCFGSCCLCTLADCVSAMPCTALHLAGAHLQ
jgi:hypothetical protein